MQRKRKAKVIESYCVVIKERTLQYSSGYKEEEDENWHPQNTCKERAKETKIVKLRL